MTTFLFASVAVSGVRVLAYTRFGRRERFILASALCFGIGNLLAPEIFTHLFDAVKAAQTNRGLKGFLDSITIVLSTPFLSSGIVAVVLNLVLPRDERELGEMEEDEEMQRRMERVQDEQERDRDEHEHHVERETVDVAASGKEKERLE